MTRANLNFISQNHGENPKTLFHYWNGDQYPTGLVDGFNLYEFLDGDWSKESFKKWVSKNYTASYRKYHVGVGKNPSLIIKPKEIIQPKILYTDGYITDYSYIFEASRKEIKIFEWDKKIFDGSVRRFKSWIIKRKKQGKS